jgi:SMODS-associating 4TM effector domain
MSKARLNIKTANSVIDPSLADTQMSNSIPQDQNTKQNLQHFVASRIWYARGKRIALLQMLIAVLLPLISALVLIWSQTPQTKAWVIFFAISASFAEAVIMERYQRQHQTNGANEQEVFDCAVLGLPWPVGLAGSKPAPESTKETVQSYKRTDPDFS